MDFSEEGTLKLEASEVERVSGRARGRANKEEEFEG